MKPEFLSQQGKALQVVIDDSARLQDSSKTTHSEASFTLDIMWPHILSFLLNSSQA